MVRLFNEGDFKEVNKWCYDRGVGPLIYSDISKIGYIYENVAVGFLYSTDSRVAIIENFVTNPRIEKEQRYKAIKEITDKILETATNLKFKKVIALTRNESIIRHCMEYGFSPVGEFKAYSKEL